MISSEKSATFRDRASGAAGGAAREPHQEPDRHHQHGAEEEIAPDPAHRVEPHVPDMADQLFDAVHDVHGIEADRREHDADEDREQDQAREHRERRPPQEPADRTVRHEVLQLIPRRHFTTWPAGKMRAAVPSPAFLLARSSSAMSVSRRAGSRGGLSQRRRLMRGNRMATPDLWRVERCSPSNATSNTRPSSREWVTSRTGPNRLMVLRRTKRSISASSASVKPK